ncbi:aminotransferase class V-fold PLP-dependent enzyme [Corynebacterium cystitidis]|uniref:Selenocysteine lyase/Cysteine desulfurase n=1 Tax=Corynebacterium cystitidis DSM 20524 TaxID=1121357 RepID=A0A1H9U5I5_9CORY|nr:aminotransferase class V-fold PLP-dependent enzyme [Corynebacterium cystitidis]WJY81176.1 Cysteine desulfurase [Corynebacterium cystitidis DSM 20524]SES04501.1 Selenocysteine lyase/Cysteine desulfurase [Corynebacterium cystitidis DSM 20524]SNV89642.1 aminotransferase [Corynebacterium cystitidis]
MTYDVFSVRGLYTSLSDGWTYLNAHDCPQIPERVSAAVARSFRMSTQAAAPDTQAGSHSRSYAGRPEGLAFVADARHAIADLVGSTADCVVLGPNLPTLYAALSAAMRQQFRYNSSVVLSTLENPAHLVAFKNTNAETRWAQPDLGTGVLPAYQYDQLVDGATRLVSIPAADGLLGTIVDVAAITECVRDRSRAWVLLDATNYAPYRLIDADEWGVDIIAVDIGALGGPQVAALVFRDEAMFRRLDTVSPLGSTEGANKLALDVAPGLAGGVSPLVEHLADLVPPAEKGRVSRRMRLETSMVDLADYFDTLAEELYRAMRVLPAVHIVGVSGEAAVGAPEQRLPRLSFIVNGVPADTVYKRLVDNRVVTTVTPPTALLADMGVNEIGGAVTVSLGPFNTTADIDHLVRVVASLA